MDSCCLWNVVIILRVAVTHGPAPPPAGCGQGEPGPASARLWGV